MNMELRGKLPPPPPVRAECPHHWEIDPPRGEFSHAKCLLCGEERDFRNRLALEDPEERKQILLKGSLKGGRKPKIETAIVEAQAVEARAEEVERMPAGQDPEFLRKRGEELKPAREAFEAMFKLDMAFADIHKVLEREFGKIHGSTVRGWWIRAEHKRAQGDTATCAKTQTDIEVSGSPLPMLSGSSIPDATKARENMPENMPEDTPIVEDSLLSAKLRSVLPEPIQALLKMLPVPDADRNRWKTAFDAAFELTYPPAGGHMTDSEIEDIVRRVEDDLLKDFRLRAGLAAK